MQVLNAPTRQEMDRAHATGQWLDVGILSVHNLRKISRNRAALCLVLAASSLPLHLLLVTRFSRSEHWQLTHNSYNAAIFKIITMSQYEVALVDNTSDLLNGTHGLRDHWNDSIRLDNARCKTIHTEPEVSRYGDLYLVIDQISYGLNTTREQSLFDIFPVKITSGSFVQLEKPTGEGWVDSSEWLQPGQQFNSSHGRNVHIVEGWTTDSGRNSRIQISLYFMIIVICFNLFKAAITVGVLTRDASEYVVTLGDAAASYLQCPEDLTRGRSTLELDQMLLSFEERYATDRGGYAWQPRRRRYCSSIGYD